ncbi:MAG TPA: 50S ribosomal protein L4 [Nitrososphaeraceae archaeon]|jgi:large subunit ribosomal protein L4e|nr:50S ribosomal protein L4 [Nitrososphaeraceae archaeon]
MILKTDVIGTDGNKLETIDLPPIFNTPFRPEVIRKSYVNVLSHSFQTQGRYAAAGEIVSAESRNTGLGIARIARARGEGFARAGQAAGVAGVRHGRVAHPPNSSKIIYKKINRKEKHLGFCSAIAATARNDLVKKRGHLIDDSVKLPIVVSNEIESVSKTKELYRMLIVMGLQQDLTRSKLAYDSRPGASNGNRKRRPGVSAMLVVRKEPSDVCKLSKSIPGVDVKPLDRINILDLVPGARPARLTIFTQNAISELRNVKPPFHAVHEVDSANEQ